MQIIQMRLVYKALLLLVMFGLYLTGLHFAAVYIPLPALDATPTPTPGEMLYLPMISSSVGRSPAPLVNVPGFAGAPPMNQMAITWFGRVTPDENYVDIRLGYSPDALVVHIAIIDRRLWCSEKASAANIAMGDSLELFLNTNSQPAGALPATSYRFTGQLGLWDCPESWTAYQGDGSAWQVRSLAFTASTGWRGNVPNDDVDDRGWTADLSIPFSSLGLAGAPAAGTIWKAGLIVHDRNDSAGRVLSQKSWPDGFASDQPASWANLSFGLPVYTAPSAAQTGVVTVRNQLNGVTVTDGQVGGGAVCGEGLDFWTQWGQTSYPGRADNDQVNIQNQGDIADWPCFSKFYITFPLDSIPAGKVILSAQLRLHQFGNAGGPGSPPPRSLIQVFTVGSDWNEATLNWNNAPQMTENVSQAWVDPLSAFPGFPGVLRTWDVSRAVDRAYLGHTPLRLALYSADEGYHSGKYFVSSDTGDWNAEARPELQVVIGNP